MAHSRSYEFDCTFVDAILGPVGILGYMSNLGTLSYGPEEWWVETIGHATNPSLTWYLAENQMDAFTTRNLDVLQAAVNQAADGYVEAFNAPDY